MKVLEEKIFVFANFRGILVLMFLVLAVPLLVFAASQAVRIFGKAAPIPANILVEGGKFQGVLSRPWEGLSQGGEQEVPGRLVGFQEVSSKVKSLGVRYVRVDHVMEEPFWDRRKERIQEILDMGAIPFISLSYFSKDVADSNIGTVSNWELWQEKVRQLVGEVSGRNGMNVAGVYYEVWNEPDGSGFGGFSVGGGKDYYLLYKKTVEAVLSVPNTNSFKVGGPALADLRRCVNGALFVCQKFWLDRFLELSVRDGTRVDFISWHRYSMRLSDYKEDTNFILNLLNKYPRLVGIEKIITEWGSDPARSPIHNSVFDAAHLVVAARTFVGFVDLATKFEVRDGPDNEEKGWGILYHNGSEKPTFSALKLLSLLRRDRVQLSGEGSFVYGIGSRDNSGVTAIFANYDRGNANTEKVPIKVTGLTSGNYRIAKWRISNVYPLGKLDETNVVLEKGEFVTSELMLPNSIVLFDIQLVGLL